VQNKITVIIPTRERAATLLHSLRSCVAQDYDQLHILVSDNASEDETRDVVHSLNDPRIRYINPGRRVSMVENFEFAFSHVDDGYVVSIGDDDGLAIEGIRKINELIKTTGMKAIVSDFAQYIWPNIGTAAANQLSFSPAKGYEIRQSRIGLQKVLYRRHPFNHLPCIYYGCIDVQLINALRAKQGGRLFMTSVVDVYTAIALTANIENYCFSFEPLTINGTSGRSNGAAFMRISGDQSEKQRWYLENTTTLKPPFFASGGIKMLIAEACYALQQVDPHALPLEDVDFDELLQQSIEDLILYPKFGFDESHLLSLARDFGAQVNSPGILRRIKARLQLYEDRAPKFLRNIMVNASGYGVNDVYSAAVLMEKLRAESIFTNWIAKLPLLLQRFLSVR
jgi:Glycosyl transferase family 2